MLESLKRILDKLSTFDLASWLNSVTISGYKVGLDTAQKDLKEEYPSEPDMEAIVRIGMRAHALSEKAIARAKGGMAHNADKLYQEMDAAMKAGMSEKEALHQIQGRLKGLFTDSYQEWELERLVRDQFLVATKEGRRAGWQNGGMKYRQWKIHRDNKTAADSKRMEGQITEIDKPYTDPLTGEKYMLAHIRPNDRCFSVGLWELPEDTIERDGLVYAKNLESDFIKGGPGSGIKGHKTEKKLPKQLLLPDGVADILYKYEYMEKLNEHQLERFRKQILDKVKDAKKKYAKIAGYFPGDTEFERLHRKLVVDLGKLENKLESAFSIGEKKIAIDAVFQLTHIHGRYAIFEGTGEDIKRALDYIRDQRIHKFSKGGPGSGIKGHKTEKKYKNILSFENQIRNKKKENGLLCDKDGNILLTAEGTEDTISFSPSDRELFFNKAAGGIFTHNHPLGNSFSKADILSSMKAKLQEVRVVGKEYTHSIKFKKEVPANIRNEFPHRYDQVFAETYVLFRHKIFDGMSNRKAQQFCFHKMIQKISKEYSEYFTYKRTTSFSKGGIGSGIRGHTTAKKEKPKLYKVVEDFEEKYRNRVSEIGLTTDKEGNVLLIKKGTKTRIKFTPEEWEILSSEKSYLFTHNHGNDATLSPADFDLMWRAGLKETRAVGPTNTFILKFKKKIPEEVFRRMLHIVKYKDEVFYHKYTSKVQRGEMKADIATIAYADEAIEAFVKEFPEYLSYEKITTIKKGGVGSGIKGHRTQREKKVYKMIKNFENKIRGESIESCFVTDGEGKVLISKQGTKDTICLTENERYTCREKAKKGKVIFSHNHPSSSSFSLDDILTANNFHFSESRIASKKHDYVMKISKPLDRDEVMTSYRAQNAYYYEIFNPLVVSEKLDRNKAWMTHTHLIWKHVAEEIDGLEYKRTR